MTSGLAERYDFFLSRRGSVAAIAREVTDVLLEKGYKVRVEDYDFRLGTSFIEEMHEAITRSRGLIILFTEDYLRLPYTRKEFTSFEAQRLRSPEERHVAILRCEDAPLEGLLADVAYQNLVGVVEPDERKRRIIAAAERQSQSAPPPPRPRPFMGVPPRIASFTGRAHDLTRLDAILMQERSAAVTQAVGRAAIQGMGGVGKTSLVVEYAHRYRKLYAGVCWCPAETRTGLLSALASLAVALGAARPEEADVDSAAKAALRRLAEQHATWLLIYDNVTAPDHVADLLPSAGARVLITSRFSDWGEVADEVALDVLPLEEAVALLQGRTARSDAAGARMLAEALGCLPLALDHAAAYCRRSQMRFADYAKKASSIISTVPRGAGYPRSVAATFDLAIAEAVAQCQAAEALMAYLAQCAPERIPMTLIEGAIEDEAERMKALTALSEVSLAEARPFRGRHACGDGASSRAGSGNSTVGGKRLGAGRQRAIDCAAWGDLPRGRALQRPELVASVQLSLRRICLRCAKRAPMPHRTLLTGPTSWTGQVTYLDSRAAYSQATAVVRDVLTICEKVLGPEHPDTARASTTSPSCSRTQGDFAGARPLYERALAIREKVLGPEHPDTATSLNNLAILLQDQGDFAGARPLFERALAIREKALGPEHPDTATSLNNLASLLQDQGDFAAARPLFERALAIREKVLGPEHPDTATSLNNLASLLQAQGDLAAARPLYERALAIREKVLGPEHPDTATSLNNLASLLQAQGDLAAARPLYERALAIREKVLGPEHPDTATSLNNLAILLQAQGDLCSGAAALRARAGDTRKGARPRASRYGGRASTTSPSCSRPRATLPGRGRSTSARWRSREKALGPEHPDTATSLNNLANRYSSRVTLRGRGHSTSARWLSGRRRSAPEHPNTNRARSNLSRLLLMSGQPTEAFAASETALIAHDKVLGRDHRWTKDSARVTADALDALGRTEEAKALRERYGLTPPEKPQSS